MSNPKLSSEMIEKTTDELTIEQKMEIARAKLEAMRSYVNRGLDEIAALLITPVAPVIITTPVVEEKPPTTVTTPPATNDDGQGANVTQIVHDPLEMTPAPIKETRAKPEVKFNIAGFKTKHEKKLGKPLPGWLYESSEKAAAMRYYLLGTIMEINKLSPYCD